MAERKTETRCAPVEATAVGPRRGVSQPQVGPKPASGNLVVAALKVVERSNHLNEPWRNAFPGSHGACHTDSQCLCASKKAHESKRCSPVRNSPRVQSSVMIRRKSQFRFSLANHQRVTANGIKCGSLHSVPQACAPQKPLTD